MMLCDTLSARVFSIWYNHLLPDTRTSPEKLPESLLLSLYIKIDDFFQLQGNKVYRSLGLYEPLILATMLDRFEVFKKASDLLKWVEKEAQNLDRSPILGIIGLLKDQVLTCPQLAEMHGLFRHWGHPTVHEELGCEKTSHWTHKVIPKTFNSNEDGRIAA
jgi:hypothetical protein